MVGGHEMMVRGIVFLLSSSPVGGPPPQEISPAKAFWQTVVHQFEIRSMAAIDNEQSKTFAATSGNAY